ncbi:MAG: MATE family efflux transporter [Flavobacterium sp. MedPE-SWcel]|uniref:MATE family efflux transporter n=1 Tax=uncultured Flavobacterium sp. TaxID=165435 RepID=UPI0009238538|nr:MATE family efflux transporter [uncultured Flavobacterium sp.]OIQ16221.1 MAG: MATE family efflux transporter [Flavobacterium sp. MedPE-SWcel]
MKLSAYIKEFEYNIRLAWPVILGMLGHTITGIIDNIMVGKLGAAELAAASLGNSMVFIAMSVGIGFSTAITPIVAQYDAEKNKEGVRTVFHHGLFLCTILGVFLFGLVWFSKPLMYLMGQPDEVVALAAPYIDWVAFSLLPMVIFQGYKQFSDGLSFTKYAMYAVIISNVINVVINYLLIYGIWIFPQLGIIGAALGTVISRVFMLVYIHYILVKNEKLKVYFTNFSLKEIKKPMLRRITSLGVPSSMQMLFEVALFTAAIWLSGFIGKSSQAANQIALSLASMTFMFAMGLSVASTIRVGNQKGLKDYNKLLLVARSIFLLAVLVEIVFALLFVIFHKYLPHFFLNMKDATLLAENTEVISIAAELLLVAAVFQISDGIQVVVLGALRGLQDVKVPTVITFISYWVVGFPISLYLGVYTSLGATGIWIGLLAGLTVAALFLYIRFNYLTKRLIVEAK